MALMLAVILYCSFLSVFRFTALVKADSDWLSGWQYRKSHVIESASGAGANYQVRIKVHYGSGTDSGENVYLNEHCRTDFGDIRFTDDDGVTELDYWMEEKVDSEYAIFWVEVKDDLSNSDVTIYIYYGNSDATTTSNGTETFLFFKDFEDGTTQGLTVTAGAFEAYYEGGDYGYVLRQTDTSTGNRRGYWAGCNLPDNIAVEGKGKRNQANAGGAWNILIKSGSYDYRGLWGQNNNLQIKKDNYDSTSGTSLASATLTGHTNWFDFSFKRLSDGTLKFKIDDTEITASNTDLSSPWDVGIWCGPDYYKWDNIRVRKYVEPEPSHGSWGSEEQYSYDIVGHTSNIHGSICKFYCKWRKSMDGWIFSWNGTGEWTNSSWHPWTGSGSEGWSNITRRLDKAGLIQYKFYMNDTEGNWYSTEVYSFETVEPDYSFVERLDVAELSVISSTWQNAATNLSFTYDYGAGWVIQEINEIAGNDIKIYDIHSENEYYVNGYEVQFYAEDEGAWLTPDMVVACSEDGDSDNFIDGDTSTCWTASAVAWIEVLFYCPHNFTKVKIWVDSENDRSKWYDVDIDIRLYYPEDWNEVGTSPYLNSSDYPSNYIWADASASGSKQFKFENLTGWLSLSNIWLILNISISSTTSKLYIACNTLTYEGENVWTCHSVTVSQANTWEVKNITLDIDCCKKSVNNLKIIFVTESNETYKIDEAYLSVKVKEREPESLIEYIERYTIGLNYTESIQSLYFGYVLNYTSKEEIKEKFESLTDWREIIKWAPVLEYLGIENETKVKWALDNAEWAGDLPATGNFEVEGGGTKKGYNLNSAYILWGYYYADKYNYALSTWNITKAFNYFKDKIGDNITNNPDSPPAAILEDGTFWYGGLGYLPRLYDEVCGAINTYIAFYRFGNITEALELASSMWEKAYDIFWSTYWIPEGYFKYALTSDLVEWQSGGVLLRIAKLKYFNNSVSFERMYPNFEHRALMDAWYSKTWCYQENDSYYAVVHSYKHNQQRRLHGTMRLWAALQQLYLKFNSSCQENMIAMLEGSPDIEPQNIPAWKLLLSEKTDLFIHESLDNPEYLHKFKWDNNGVPSDSATIAGLILMLTLGIYPNTTTIAFPLIEEKNIDLRYYLPSLYQLDLIEHKLKLPILRSGTMYFKLNATKVQANFTEGKGVYIIKFSSDWNSILSVTYLSDLPSNIPFLYTIVYKPTASNIGATNNVPNESCTFHAYWTAELGLDTAIFYWNVSGTMQPNGTISYNAETQAWSNFTRLLPDQNGITIAWYIICNDTEGQWGNTSVQFLVLSINLTVSFNETLHVSGGLGFSKALLLSFSGDMHSSSLTVKRIELYIQISDLAVIAENGLSFKEFMLMLTETATFSASASRWRETILSVSAYININDLAKMSKEQLIVVVASPKSNDNLHASFELLIISLEVVNSETVKINAVVYALKEKLVEVQELSQIVADMKASKEKAVIAFVYSKAETASIDSLVEVLKALGFTSWEINHATVTQIHGKEKQIIIIEIPKQKEEMNMWKAIKISLVQIFELIKPKATMIPTLPQAPTEQIDWGLIALGFAMIAFVLAATALTAKRD